jgi:hypothetical protein
MVLAPAKKPASQRSLHGVSVRTFMSDSELLKSTSSIEQVSSARDVTATTRNELIRALVTEKKQTSERTLMRAARHSSTQMLPKRLMRPGSKVRLQELNANADPYPALDGQTVKPAKCLQDHNNNPANPIRVEEAIYDVTSAKAARDLSTTTQPTRRPVIPPKASSLRSVPVTPIRRSGPRSINVASTSTSTSTSFRVLSPNGKRPSYQTSKSESVIKSMPRSPYPLADEFPGISSYGCQTSHKSFHGVTSYSGNSSLPNLFDDTSTAALLNDVRKEKLVSSVDAIDIKKQRSSRKENTNSTSSRGLSSKAKILAYQTSKRENKRIFTTTIHSSSRTPADKIQMSAIGAVARYDKIENARSAVIAVREQRRPLQESLERRLLANEMGLIELRKIVDAWKGDDISLQKFEAVVAMKAKDCNKTRKLVAEANNKWGSTPRQLNATPSMLQKQSSRRKLQKQSSSRSKKQSGTRRVVASCA